MLCLNIVSFALDHKDSGVKEINHNLAKATLDNITTHLEYAEKVVVNDIYPYTSSYTYTQKSTGIYAYLVNNTGNTSTFNNWITTVTNTNSGSYVKNPYIYKLAIVNYGLKIQMQFISNYVTSTSNYSTSKLAIFEPFLGRRIILVPNIQTTSCGSSSLFSIFSVFSILSDILDLFNITDSECGTQTVVTGNGINYWTCFTDADETVASSANGISEGSTSIISIAGGVLDGCTYIKSSNLNSIWINI